MSEEDDRFGDVCQKIDVSTRVDGPHAYVQWKGTDACLDVRCACGGGFHIDAEFAYIVRCPECKEAFGVGPYVKLVPLSEQEVADYKFDPKMPHEDDE